MEGNPHTVLAPQITLALLSDTSFLGCSLSDQFGTLTKEGLCAFWMVVSAVVCTVLYVGGRFYSPIFFKCYSGLSIKDRREWDVRYSSMIHSFLCVWYAYIILWDSDFFFKDGPVPHMLRTDIITYTELGISMGYFFVDFFVCLKYNMGGAAMMAHHLGTIAATVCAIAEGQCHILSVWILVTEFTTPFINFRWWLEKSGMKSTQLYIINGVGIFLGWIAARILIFPPFFYTVYLFREELHLLKHASYFMLCFFPPALCALNLWWFSKIVKGVVKVLGGSSKAKQN